MSYEQQISRNSPTAFLFLVDQSGSMSDKMSSGKSKAEFVSDVLNNTIKSLILKCSKSDGVRDYFEIGVIGYGHNFVGNSLSPDLQDKLIQPISRIEQAPLRVEERKKRMDDGAGGLVEVDVKFPVWFEPKANGGTPMNKALTMAAEELVAWCENHKDSYPPTVLHITDGESTDGNPEQVAELLKQINTDDGNVLVFNLHVSTLEDKSITYPSTESSLPDDYAKMLFRMSSVLPEHMIENVKEKRYEVDNESRGFIFNAEAADIVDFFDIGTRASQLR